jgi:hypothetical protein
MTVDYTKLREALSPLPQISGDEKTSMRVAEVTAINSADGTVDVLLSETAVENVPVLDSVVVFVGSIVQMLTYRGSMLVIGTVAVTADNDSTIGGSNTPQQPLVSSANTDALITAVTHEFIVGYAYEISWFWAAQINNGTSPFVAYSRLRRLNTSGTPIEETLHTAIVGSNITRVQGSVFVKCSVATTTQTIALCGGFGTNGSPTSIDLEAASTRRTRLHVKRVGTADKYSGYLEVPTA